MFPKAHGMEQSRYFDWCTDTKPADRTAQIELSLLRSFVVPEIRCGFQAQQGFQPAFPGFVGALSVQKRRFCRPLTLAVQSVLKLPHESPGGAWADAAGQRCFVGLAGPPSHVGFGMRVDQSVVRVRTLFRSAVCGFLIGLSIGDFGNAQRIR